MEPAFKICQVCGDKAMYHNFGGLSCESCKIFFRRHAPNYEQIKCINNTEDCPVDSKLNRSNCKLCRLNKCMSIGMRKELISLKKDNNSCKAMKMNKQNQSELGKVITANTCKMPCTLSNIRQIFTEFDDLELARYSEVQQAMVTSNFPDEFGVPTFGEARDLLHTFNLPALYIRKIIKFCKNIEAFRCLQQDDQIAILREFYSEICCLRFAFLFDVEKDAFRVIGNETENQAIWIQMKVYAQFHQRNNLASIYRHFFTSLNLEMQNDSKLRNLLIGYFLFNDRQNVSCPDFLRSNRSIYSQLLRKYLGHKYSSNQQKYSTLMNSLSGVSTICNVTREVYASLPAAQLAKVLAEIYNPGYQILVNHKYSGFCSENVNQIGELQNSIKIDNDDQTIFEISNSQPQDLMELLNLGEFYVRKVVKFCCSFGSFKALNGDEQKSLLKNSILEMIIVYAAYFYDHQQDGISLIVNETGNKGIFFKFQKCHLVNLETINIFKEFASEISAEIGNDLFLRNLIMIQLLFKVPHSASHQQVNTIEYINYNSTFYRHLMLRYFEHNFSDKNIAEMKFANLMNLLNSMDIVCDAIRKLYTQQIDTGRLSQLLKEVFDIV